MEKNLTQIIWHPVKHLLYTFSIVFQPQIISETEDYIVFKTVTQEILLDNFPMLYHIPTNNKLKFQILIKVSSTYLYFKIKE